MMTRLRADELRRGDVIRYSATLKCGIAGTPTPCALQGGASGVSVKMDDGDYMVVRADRVYGVDRP